MPHTHTRRIHRLSPVTSHEEQASLRRTAHVLAAMVELPTHEAAGAAFAFLLHMADADRPMLRRLLSEPVVKEGFRGVPMLTVLTRISKE